jgi:hypothetical protein
MRNRDKERSMRKTFLAIAILGASLAAAYTQTTQNSAAGSPLEKDFVDGRVISVSKDSFAIKSPRGNTWIIQLNEHTMIREQTEEQPVKLRPLYIADIKKDDKIVAVGVLQGDILEASRIVVGRIPEHSVVTANGGAYIGGIVIHDEDIGVSYMIGEVKAIHGSTLTILRRDGKTQETAVDENTIFRLGVSRVLFHDVNVGDSVSGPGKLKDNVFVFQELHINPPVAKAKAIQPQENKPPVSPALAPAK